MDLQGKHIQVFAKVISHVNTIRKSAKTNRIIDRIFLSVILLTDIISSLILSVYIV
jgi:hypothetical protein